MMGHQGEVSLAQNISVYLNELDVDLKNAREDIDFCMFSISLFPTATDIVPFTGRNCEQASALLAEHLRYLLADPQFNESYRELKISLMATICPEPTTREKFSISLKYGVSGPFMDYFEKLSAEQTLVFKVKLSNFLSKEIREEEKMTMKYLDLRRLRKGERIRTVGPYCYGLRWIPGMVDMLNGRPFEKRKEDVKLSVALCADLTERMTLPLPIFSPNGMHYQLSMSLDVIMSQRKKNHFMNNDTVILIADNDTRAECNYACLVESSPVFQTMLNSESFEEARTRTIDMSDMSEDGVMALINYVCYFDLDLPLKHFSVALQLLQASEKYSMDGLKTTMKTLLQLKKCEDYDIGDAINLFTFSRLVESMVDLRDKALKVLRLKYDELLNCQSFERLFVKQPRIAMELCKIILQSFCICEKINSQI